MLAQAMIDLLAEINKLLEDTVTEESREERNAELVKLRIEMI